MHAQNYNVIGVMSGTSLDGVDLAHLHFSIADGRWHFEILECETVAYDQDWVDTLRGAVGFSATQLQDTNVRYTQLLGGIISDFIARHAITHLDAVCSHGHTVLHQPQNGLTLQIGNLHGIASLTGQRVVCDFRVQDVALGGQGAPLVPIGDRILFSEFDYCLNLGGFSNISFERDGKRIAFDICAVNTVLNHYANQLGHDYDDRGHLARSGTCDGDLKLALDAVEYYHRAYPKSLGFESVKHLLVPLIDARPMCTTDKMRTFTEHIAYQIARALPGKSGKMLLTGGGAYNDFLIEKIARHLPGMQLTVPEPKVLEFKEALIFGLLGVLRLRGEINVLSSVTGASHDHSSGVIFN